MRMIKRAALAVGLGGALVLGSAGVSLAAPTAHPAAPVALDDSDGLGGLLGALLGDDDDDDGDDDSHGLLGGLLGNVGDDDGGEHSIKVVCDDDEDSDDDGDDAQLI